MAMRAALWLGGVAVLAAPVVSAVSAIRQGWLAAGDSAGIAAYTSDTFSTNPPLVGMPTSLPPVDGDLVFHLGPLGFWTLALPTRVLSEPGQGLVVGAAGLSVLSLLGVAVLVRHWPWLAKGILLVVVALMVASVGGNLLADPFNPHLGLLPLLLFLVAACGVIAGNPRQLVVAVIAGSFAAQVHAGYVPIVVLVSAVVVAALAHDLRRAIGASRRHLTHRLLPLCVGLGALLWIGPIIDQVAGHGNLTRAVASQDDGSDTLGWSHGVDLLVDMTTLPPRWMIDRAVSGAVPEPSGSRWILSLLVIGSAVAITLWAVGTRRRLLASLGLVSMSGLAAATWASSQIQVGLFTRELLFYRLFWWPVGAILMTTVCWGIVSAVAVTLRPGEVGRRSSRQPVWVLAPLAATAAIVSVDGFQLTEPGGWSLAGTPAVHAEAVSDLPSRPSIVAVSFPPSEGPPGWTAAALTFVGQLRLRNVEVRFTDEALAGVIAPPLRAYRADHPVNGSEDVHVLFVVGAEAAAPPPTGYVLVSRSPAGESALLNAPSAVFVRVE